MTSNLLNTSKLFSQSGPSTFMDEKTIETRINSFFQISIRSNKIFFKENKNNSDILDCVLQIHANVAQYVRDKSSQMSKSWLAKWRRLLNDTIKPYVSDLESESNAKYRRINYRLVFYLASTIEVYILWSWKI